MSAWDLYEERLRVRGVTKRDATKKREIRNLNLKLPGSLSYHFVDVYHQSDTFSYKDDTNPVPDEQQVAIINSDNLDEKYLYSMPGEDIEHGSLVYWMGNYWLVTERDANTTLYTKSIMQQCNYLLRWVTDEGKVCQQWCIINDGTKYMNGILEDRNFITTRGDSRITLTISRNKETVKFDRDNRFVVDDADSDTKLTYWLSKPTKIGATYNGNGIFKFVLQEVTGTIDDNYDVNIADYYKQFPKTTTIDQPYGTTVINDEPPPTETGKKVWL